MLKKLIFAAVLIGAIGGYIGYEYGEEVTRPKAIPAEQELVSEIRNFSTEFVKKPNKTLSIVIPTFNRITEMTATVLLLVARIRAPKDRWEIVLVDDGSTDGSGDFIKSLNIPNVRVVWSDKDKPVYRSCGFPRNSGIQAAKGDIIAICDADCFHMSDPVTPTLELFDKHEHIFVSGRIHYTLENSKNELYLKEKARRLSIAPPCGGWLAAPREIFMKVGGYDQRLEGWGDEDDDMYDLRFKRLGLKQVKSKRVIYTLAHEITNDHKDMDNETIKKTFLKNKSMVRQDPTIVRNKGQNWGHYVNQSFHPKDTFELTTGY